MLITDDVETNVETTIHAALIRTRARLGAVYGSTELSHAELSLEADAFPDLTAEETLRAVRKPQRRYVMTVTMKRFIVVYGADYPSCLRSLLLQWEPS